MAPSSGPHCPPPDGLLPPQPSASLFAHTLPWLCGSRSASPLGVGAVHPPGPEGPALTGLTYILSGG